MKPFFTHDCQHCIHMFSVDRGERKADVYVCPQTITLASIIVRTGNEGPSYYSTIPSCLDNPPMTWEYGLAAAAWIQYQERDMKNVQQWCEFINAGKLFKEIYTEKE